jgi:hypothetical protein
MTIGFVKMAFRIPRGLGVSYLFASGYEGEQ